MATQAETKIVDLKAEAAAEKAYAQAADAVSPKKADAKPAAAKPASAKIDAALAEVKAAPKPANKIVGKAKPAAAKRAAKKAPAKKAADAKTIAAPKRLGAKPAAKVAKRTATTAAKASAKPALTTITKLKDTIMAAAQNPSKTTTDFTKSVKETAADAQTRAKAAYDKLQAYAGQMTEFTKGNVEAIVASGKILGAGVQTLARGEVEAAKGAFETATADLKAMVAVKSPTELFKLQGEIARRNFDALVARTSKNAEVSMKLANDAFAPISGRMSLAAEKISKAA